MIEMRMAPGLAAAGALAAVKAVAWDHPGDHELRLLIGERRLVLGGGWKFGDSEAGLAALAEFGTEPPKVVQK